MSKQKSEGNTGEHGKTNDTQKNFVQADGHATLDDDTLKQTQSNQSSRAALIQKCLNRGSWTLEDDGLNTIIRGISSSQKLPSGNVSTSIQQDSDLNNVDEASGSDTIAPEESRAIILCHKEQGHRREVARATRLLHRHRLVQRRYLELHQDSIHKEKPLTDYVLKRRALEQIMRETKDQHTFPLALTNDSIAQKIEDFAIKAQRKPYYDIGIWGFAVLRLNYSDDAAWESYKRLLETSAQKRLLGCHVPQHICDMFRFTYLEDEIALSGPVDQSRLVKYWDENKYSEDVHLHINKQFFFSTDEFAREGENPEDPPLNIHDASVEEAEEGNFPGWRKTSIFELVYWHIADMEKSRLHLRSAWEIVHS